MKRLKLVLGVCILYLFVVFGGTGLMMYLDSKFYGNARAAEEIQDDSEYHYNTWMQWKAEIAEKAKYRVVYVFPDDDDKLTKLTVVHDPVLDMYCYSLKNRPYQFKTGLNCFPGWYIRGTK